ncbi:LLM class flavin-dependent oxidoreductase [Actinomadura viridis]|uniref:Alkanesulfonate monooxygenase SsuD/methylene tetrahydromethanopterin reductase-like flavin-dependent oxidoreductase (Luciferase family) n=2 Tax=Actinomadura viridis TaxID=58110 RepID=A0A931GHW8_9ACTN|nr:alkanesulfonate monooxygenase SsuD/methylene tetrahydromethanopterin reductase-like flavin-dependent oxidoreductase (luciferase family) [Actinomadura viridis]
MADRPMKFSTFHLFHQFAGQSAKEVYDYQIEIVELLEELGFDGVWVAEHHFRDYGVVPNIFTLLANLAARTERLRLGTGIVVLPLHNPVHVAEEAAMVDLLSGGRLELGIGRGYQSIEFENFGLDLSEARDRFNESLDMLLGLWTRDDFEYKGRFHETRHPLTLMPKPVQRPHPPLHVAAVSPETVEMYAARGLPILADPAAPFKKIAKAAETWHATAAANGVDTTGVELVASRSVYVAPTLEQAREDQARFEEGFDRSRIFNLRSAPIDPGTGQAAKGFEFYQDRYLKGGSVDNEFRWNQLEIIGDPERVIAQIQTVRDMGYGNLMCDFGSTRELPIEEMKKVLRFFAAEVMPAFR